MPACSFLLLTRGFRSLMWMDGPVLGKSLRDTFKERTKLWCLLLRPPETLWALKAYGPHPTWNSRMSLSNYNFYAYKKKIITFTMFIIMDYQLFILFVFILTVFTDLVIVGEAISDSRFDLSEFGFFLWLQL